MVDVGLVVVLEVVVLTTERGLGLGILYKSKYTSKIFLIGFLVVNGISVRILFFVVDEIFGLKVDDS